MAPIDPILRERNTPYFGGYTVPVNRRKLALCVGLVAALAAPFVTGSVSALKSFPTAEYQARKQYTVAASATASGQTLEKQYTQFLATCRAQIQEHCERVRSGEVKDFLWTLGACPANSQAETNCMKAWAELPPSTSILAYANAIMMAAPELLPVARDFVIFFIAAGAIIYLWSPFTRWLRV